MIYLFYKSSFRQSKLRKKSYCFFHSHSAHYNIFIYLCILSCRPKAYCTMDSSMNKFAILKLYEIIQHPGLRFFKLLWICIILFLRPKWIWCKPSHFINCSLNILICISRPWGQQDLLNSFHNACVCKIYVLAP